MDTTTNQQIQNKNANTIVEFPKQQSNGSVQPIPKIDPVIQQIPQTVTTPNPQPVSNGQKQKEYEPVPSLTISPEAIHETEHVVELSPEVKATGVETVLSNPTVTEEAKSIGLELAKEAALEEKKLDPELTAPLTREQSKKIVKGLLILKNTSNSMLWLAMLILRQLQMRKYNKKEKDKKL